MLKRFYRMVRVVKIMRLVRCEFPFAVERTVDQNADIVAGLVGLAMRAISSQRMCRARARHCSLAKPDEVVRSLGAIPSLKSPNGAGDDLCRRIARIRGGSAEDHGDRQPGQRRQGPLRQALSEAVAVLRSYWRLARPAA